MIGTTLGPYRIDAALGAGGMGTVYAVTVAGRCPGLAEGTRVALKIVHPHLLSTPGFFKRFLREAEIGRSVVHENVVRTFDADAIAVGGAQQHFIVMELVEGQTLRALLAELDRVPEELCRHIGREVAKGLAAIHAAGVVHRDVKPENVLITKEHVVKLMDLGVARLTGEALRLSQTGAFVGSIHYAAPECFAEGGRHVDGRADLHALGLVLYELACGVNPYLADDVPQTLRRVLHEEPRRLGDVNPQLSPFFEEVVHCLLAKRPADRFADAGALAAVLEEGERSTWWKARAKAIRASTKRPLRRVRVPRETAVYGREAELATLRALFAKAKAGEGQVVLVEGEAGIGKSRVVDELIGLLQRDGEDLNFLFGSYPPGGAATASGAFSTAYREQFGDLGCSSWLPQTPVLVPAFDALLRGETTPSGCEPLTKDSIHTCFVHATRSLAAERTTVVLVDDLHFAPEEGRALFAALAMAVPGHRILLVGTTRPGLDEKWLSGLDRIGAARLALHRLGPKDLLQLLGDTLRSEKLAAEIAAQVALKSDGNPFFVFEILRGLREGQFISQKDDGTWVSTRVIADIRIPSSVLDLVNARVADLSADERNLLDVAACWGFEFDPLLVGEVLGIPQIPLMRALGQIEKKHRLVRAAGRRYVFDHHQVQEALYGAMSELLREPYHAALAAALETRAKAADADPETLDGALCVDLCEHFLKGAQGDRALRYLAAAQAHLMKGYQNAQAAALDQRALAVPGLLAGTARSRTLLRLCAPNGPLDQLGRRDLHVEGAQEAARIAEAAGDGEVLALAMTVLGNGLSRVSRLAEAESSLLRALEIARARGDTRTEASAETSLGATLYSAHRPAEARKHHERSIAIYREIGNRQGEGAATHNLGMVFLAEGRLAQARDHFERPLVIFREIGHRRFEANSTLTLAAVFRMEGRLGEARALVERALAICREIGSTQGEAYAVGELGVTCWSEGRLGGAREQFEREAAIWREIGSRASETVACQNLAGLLADGGENASARDGYLAALKVGEELGDPLIVARSHLALGELHAKSGEEPLARESFTKARDVASETGFFAFDTLARCRLACLPGGDAKDAERSFTANEDRMVADDRCGARLLLWKATGDRAHLAEAKRLLDGLLALAPVEHHATMLSNLRVHREIAAEAVREGL